MKPKPFEFPEGESFYDVLKRLTRVKYDEVVPDKKEKKSLDHISLEGCETEIKILMKHCGYTREEAEQDLRELADTFCDPDHPVLPGSAIHETLPFFMDE